MNLGGTPYLTNKLITYVNFTYLGGHVSICIVNYFPSYIYDKESKKEKKFVWKK